MENLSVDSIRYDETVGSTVLVLKTKDGLKWVPIWVAPVDAAAISSIIDKENPPKQTYPHDLIVRVVAGLGAQITAVIINSYSEGQFGAVMLIDEIKIECRVSDGVAVALRAEVPILITEDVLDEVWVESFPSGVDEMSQFKEFLDEITAEDFDDQHKG